MDTSARSREILQAEFPDYIRREQEHLSVIVDTSFVFALYNSDDTNHVEALSFASAYRETVVVTDVILPELGFLFQRDLGYVGLIQFLDQI